MLVVNEYVNVLCVWCPEMDWRTLQGAFPPGACSQVRLRIQWNPKHYNVVTEDERVNFEQCWQQESSQKSKT